MEKEQKKDEKLWKIAKKRGAFQRHLVTYVIINAFLWAVWFVLNYRDGFGGGLPWPVWVTLGWGIGIAFSYYNAYIGSPDSFAEKEYQRLTQEQQRHDRS